jgi:hypothetical protein
MNKIKLMATIQIEVEQDTVLTKEQFDEGFNLEESKEDLRNDIAKEVGLPVESISIKEFYVEHIESEFEEENK